MPANLIVRGFDAAKQILLRSKDEIDQVVSHFPGVHVPSFLWDGVEAVVRIIKHEGEVVETALPSIAADLKRIESKLSSLGVVRILITIDPPLGEAIQVAEAAIDTAVAAVEEVVKEANDLGELDPSASTLSTTKPTAAESADLKTAEVVSGDPTTGTPTPN